jgi:hypothetical protein
MNPRLHINSGDSSCENTCIVDRRQATIRQTHDVDGSTCPPVLEHALDYFGRHSYLALTVPNSIGIEYEDTVYAFAKSPLGVFVIIALGWVGGVNEFGRSLNRRRCGDNLVGCLGTVGVGQHDARHRCNCTGQAVLQLMPRRQQ